MTQAARPWLAPLVPLYRFGLALRGFALRAGLEPVRRLGAPVVSIGNLSTGGAGKTPLTIALAQVLARRGLHVDVLSRGYGRNSKATARVDPNGTAEDFGDEPLVIAREAGVPVYVAAQRFLAGMLGEQEFSTAQSESRSVSGRDIRGSGKTSNGTSLVTGHDFSRAESAGNESGHDFSRAESAENESGHDFSRAERAGNESGHDFSRAESAGNESGHDFSRAESAENESGHDFSRAESAGNESGHDFSRAESAENESGHDFSRAERAGNESGHDFSRAESAENESGHDFSRAEDVREDEGALAPAHNIHLLDDGFQHRQLHRDVDILLFSSADIEDRLLPAGNLREPLEAFHRATVLAIPFDDQQAVRYLNETILIDRNSETQRWNGPVWRLHRRMQVPAIDGPVVAFCGIARPDQFFAGLVAAGLHVASRIAFADHQRYVQHDIDCILDAAHTTRATALIATEKDRVRLAPLLSSIPADLPLETAGLRIEIEDEDAAIDWLLGRIANGNVTP